MKKIVIAFIVLFLFIPKINATSWKYELPLNKNIIIDEIEERYKWYKVVKTNNRTENAFEHGCEYFDEVNSSFSDWSEEKPEEKNNRMIETREEIKNSEYNFIIFDNFLIESLTLKEIKITDKNKNLVPYTIIECRQCDASYEQYKYLYDNNLDTNIVIKTGSVIILKLNKKYTENFKIQLIYDSKGIIFGWSTRLTLNVNDLVKKMDFNKNNLVSVYSPVYLSYVIPINVYWENEKTNIKKFYRYKDNFVNCYDNKKEYLEGYFSQVEGYIKDETSKVYAYKYKESFCEKKECINEIVKTSDSSNSLIKDEIAINYGTKREVNEYPLLPVFIIALGGILILLVLICRKMRLNMEKSR